MRIVFLLSALALATLLSAAPSRAEDQSARIAALLPPLESNAGLLEDYSACPADIFKRRATLFSFFGTDEWPDLDGCAADIKLCHDACVQGENGQACFSLARVLQEHGAPAADRHYEPLFALACAIGKSGACTNRGGGIRNGGYAADPSKNWSEEEKATCLRRTFKMTCDKGDAWGCAMYGQSLFLGEGGAQDDVAATAAFEKSCVLDPDFASCEFSQSYLNDMKALAAPQ